MSRTSTASSSPRSPRPPPGAPIPERRDEVRSALERLGVRPARAWGQSFLVDPFVADAEAALVATRPGEPVLEIGGGLGILTRALVRRGYAPLSVIERDRRLAGFLRDAFGDRVRVLEGDALAIELPPATCVVGNLPYSVATPILLRCLARRPSRLVALVQREVADRLAAGPGSKTYGRLSLAARLYGEVELFRTVPAEAFDPVPDVASRLVVHTARPGALPVPSVPDFEAAVRTLFSSRRKQLGNLLPRVAGTAASAERLARAAGWPVDWARRRPEEIAPDGFFALARALAIRPPGSADGRVHPQP